MPCWGGGVGIPECGVGNFRIDISDGVPGCVFERKLYSNVYYTQGGVITGMGGVSRINLLLIVGLCFIHS